MLDELKSYLDFTWDDEDRERKIESYMKSSIQYLNEVAGTKIDFDTDLVARELLFNRVLYLDSKALPDFNENYSDMMNELRYHYSVKQ